MLIVIYAMAWLLAAATAGVLYLFGYINDLTLTVFGFIFSTLVFMGIVAVLPSMVHNRYSQKYSAG